MSLKEIFTFLAASFKAAPSSTYQEESKVSSLAWGAQTLRDKNVILQAMKWHRLAPVPTMCLPSSSRAEHLQKTLLNEKQPSKLPAGDNLHYP